MGAGTVSRLQRWLAARGWYSDPIDGHYGPNTSRGLGLALKAGSFRAKARQRPRMGASRDADLRRVVGRGFLMLAQ